MILFIAIGLALPVVIVGAIFKNTKAVIFAAVIMAGVGLATGNPHFIMTDLIAVGLATFIAFQFCDTSANSKSQSNTKSFVYTPEVKTTVTTNNRNLDYSILKRDISDQEDDLLRKHLSFYEDLELGIRKPESDAQHHFLAVIKGKATPRTAHEVAFLKHIKRRQKSTQ